MFKFSEFHFKKPIICCLGILGMVFLAVDATAQSENEKVEEIYPKTNDRVILEDHSLSQDNSVTRSSVVKPATTLKLVVPITVKKDPSLPEIMSERETKKNDSPSTLSFNIFLYIVDKFKAD